jgi:pimeloyl-ACP methyl ester carboxylesterase
MPLTIWPYLSLALILLGVGLVLCAATVLALARAVVTPPRMTDGKAAYLLKRLSPGDLGLRFEETAFEVHDAAKNAPLRIAAWWIPSAQSSGRTVVLLHGYADAKVGAIAWAPTWHAIGWNVLAIDLRAHGESAGRYCTGGFFEREDVAQVINQLRARNPDQTRRVALFGASFGAAVAVATAVMRDDVDALVLDSPVPDFSRGAMLHMSRMGAPCGMLRRLAVRVAERISGAKFDEVRMLDVLPRLRCPVMVIAPQLDPLLVDGYGTSLQKAVGDGVFWSVEDCGHLMPLGSDPAEYQRRIAAFLGPLC